MPLNIQTQHLPPDIVVLEMTGKITMGNDCRHLEWTAEKLVTENHKKVIFDLAGVTHVDSTGIGIIVMVAGQMKRAGGELRVAAAQDHVEKVFMLTSVDKLIPMHPTAVAAAASF